MFFGALVLLVLQFFLSTHAFGRIFITSFCCLLCGGSCIRGIIPERMSQTLSSECDEIGRSPNDHQGIQVKCLSSLAQESASVSPR